MSADLDRAGPSPPPPEVLAEILHPPRLPEAFTQLTLWDLSSSLGLGLILAALVLTVFAPLLHRRPRRASLAQNLRGASALPEPERMLALARLLAARRIALPEAQRQALYSGKGADVAALEALLRQGRPWRRKSRSPVDSEVGR